jgi:2-polyprenyl-6-methoxyphenol hydroxylase-like FAD-dependent oxidoreductase
MRIALIGAGPTGLYLGAALARRGHSVTAVDRDPGPGPDGRWVRRGVMQFEHAHVFRGQVAEALRAELPEAYDGWLAAGAEPVEMDPGGPQPALLGVRSRRSTFERALRATVAREPGLRLLRGHVEGVTSAAGRATGLLVDGSEVPAWLVIDASGRSGRATRELPPRRGIGGPCGIVYVDRVYRLRDGAEPGPMTNPIPWQGDFDGYLVLVFRHERGFFSVLLIRPEEDDVLADLRHVQAFEAACRAIPALAAWTDPDRARPVSPVLPGGNLKNHYRAQTDADGRLVLPGLVFVGDAVCTTTPNFGRGVTTSLLQARQLLRLVDEHGVDVVAVAEGFEAWCREQMRPWVEDHIRMDDSLHQRWTGHDVDLSGRLPSDLIMAASAVEPEIGAAIGPYLTMSAGPASLDRVEPLARAVYARGWRPSYTPGPSGAELRAIVRQSLS